MPLDRILVTGGAGYIGSHAVKALLAHAFHVVVLDNLSMGFIKSVGQASLIQGDVQNLPLLLDIIEAEKINTVMHFAALTSISESIQHPLKYYENNTMSTLCLLQACLLKKVKRLIFSSTAALYAPSASEKLTEAHPTVPTNPYGHSKLMSEQLIKDHSAADPEFRCIVLRYFNVAGASPDGEVGQCTSKTHLIQVATQTACHLHPCMPVYGTDYDTPDGTCIRDFVHVSDLADAHMKALFYLKEGGQSTTLNCGYGHGFSVKEVIAAVEKISQTPLPILLAPRRRGDQASVIADNTLIKKTLGWEPQFDNLEFIIKTALDWEKSLLRL